MIRNMLLTIVENPEVDLEKKKSIGKAIHHAHVESNAGFHLGWPTLVSPKSVAPRNIQHQFHSRPELITSTWLSSSREQPYIPMTLGWTVKPISHHLTSQSATFIVRSKSPQGALPFSLSLKWGLAGMVSTKYTSVEAQSFRARNTTSRSDLKYVSDFGQLGSQLEIIQVRRRAQR